MDRRQFLGGTIVSVAGLAAGGTALGATRLGRAGQERDNSVLPNGPSHELGCRQLIWSVPTSQPLAALTFDDGPDPEFTPRILGVLARYGVRATFNVMGYNAIRHRDLIQALMDNGHELGNHTWSHEDLAFQSPAATARQLDRASRATVAVVWRQTSTVMWSTPWLTRLAGRCRTGPVGAGCRPVVVAWWEPARQDSSRSRFPSTRQRRQQERDAASRASR
jgi:peptidoglycan/xylan/chitin deacetylase (PgdA/CDA1 family)